MQKRARFDDDEDGYLRPSGLGVKRRELAEEERFDAQSDDDAE